MSYDKHTGNSSLHNVGVITRGTIRCFRQQPQYFKWLSKKYWLNETLKRVVR